MPANEVYLFNTTQKRDLVEDFERNLQDLRRNLIAQRDDKEQVNTLVAKTTELLQTFDKDSLAQVVTNLSGKIMNELRSENQSQLLRLENNLRESVKENSETAQKLEQAVSDLKKIENEKLDKMTKDNADPFNKTASFKDTGHLQSFKQNTSNISELRNENLKNAIESTYKQQIE